MGLRRRDRRSRTPPRNSAQVRRTACSPPSERHRHHRQICSFNRHYAEYGGYWKTTNFLKEVDRTVQTVYYDSVSGKPLFVAPVGRSFEEFARESDSHGWPSFRDQEAVWENMRILPDGESVSVDGTHLGHNIPDRAGNRYCINLVSVAGRPLDPKVEL